MIPDYVISSAQEYLADAGVPTNATDAVTMAADVQAAIDAMGWAEVLQVLDGLPAAPTDETTETRRAVKANAEALRELVQGMALARLAVLAGEQEWPVYDDGVAAMELVGTYIDNLDLEALDTVAVALRELRGRLVEHIRRELEGATRLRQIAILSPTPALVLAWRLYGEADRDLEIVERNQIRNPSEASGSLWVLER